MIELYKLVAGFPALPGGEYIPATPQDILDKAREINIQRVARGEKSEYEPGGALSTHDDILISRGAYEYLVANQKEKPK